MGQQHSKELLTTDDYEKYLREGRARLQEEYKILMAEQETRKSTLSKVTFGSVSIAIALLAVAFNIEPSGVVSQILTWLLQGSGTKKVSEMKLYQMFTTASAINVIHKVALFFLILVLLGLIVVLRWFVNWYYDSRKIKKENLIDVLLKKITGKVEDLKKLTEFNKAKELIEHYEKELQPGALEASIKESQEKVKTSEGLGSWLIERIVMGNDTRSKFALICKGCMRHNGLTTEEEFKTIMFICRFCEQQNGPQ